MSSARERPYDDRPLRLVDVIRGADKGMRLRCHGTLTQGALPARGLLYPDFIPVRISQLLRYEEDGGRAIVDLRVRGVSERAARSQSLLLVGGGSGYLSLVGVADAGDGSAPRAGDGSLYYEGVRLAPFRSRPLGSSLVIEAPYPVPFIPGLELSSDSGNRYVVRAPAEAGILQDELPPRPDRAQSLLDWLLTQHGYAGTLARFSGLSGSDVAGAERSYQVGDFIATAAFLHKISGRIGSLAGQPGGARLEKVSTALRVPTELLRALLTEQKGDYRLRGRWIVPVGASADHALSPAARRLQQKIADAGIAGAMLSDLGKPSTEKLVRALERMGYCRVLRNGRIVSEDELARARRMLWAHFPDGGAKVGNAARTLGVSRSQAEALIAILRNDASLPTPRTESGPPSDE